jgi:hypothetical protein
MTKQDLPSIDYLRQRLRHDADTGKLFWLSLGAMPAVLRASYDEAFTSRGSAGYLRGKIDGRSFVAHRVIWALHYGEWPTSRIIHANGIYTDNRIENLRLPDERDVQRRGKNTSGVVGVSFDKIKRRWCAQLQARGTIHRLGAFLTLKEAAAARRDAEALHLPSAHKRRR